MRKYLIHSFVLIYIFFHINVFAQNYLTIYSGINLSTPKYTLENYTTNIDSSSKNGSVLPIIGVDVAFTISDYFHIKTGLGVSLLGSDEFSDPPPGINLDHNLRLNYLRIPLEMELKFIKEFGIVGGYSLNYCYRKNQNLYYFEDGALELIDIFNVLYHTAQIGLFYMSNQIYISTSYQFGLNRIWDTKDYSETRREYFKLNSLNLKIGYILFDK